MVVVVVVVIVAGDMEGESSSAVRSMTSIEGRMSPLPVPEGREAEAEAEAETEELVVGAGLRKDGRDMPGDCSSYECDSCSSERSYSGCIDIYLWRMLLHAALFVCTVRRYICMYGSCADDERNARCGFEGSTDEEREGGIAEERIRL